MLTTVGPNRWDISSRLRKTCMSDLEGDAQPVVSELDVRGKFVVSFGVRKIVGHVGKKRTSWLHAAHEGERLFERSVAGMRRLAQGVKNDDIQVLEQGEAAFRDIA